MDAFIFRLLAAELTAFARGARVEKIHSPAPGFFTFTLFQHGQKQQMVWRASRNAGSFYLTQHKLPNPETPTSDVMRLRKYLAGRRLGGAVSAWPDRTLYFHIPASTSINHQLWLKCSLVEGPSLTSEPPELPRVSLPDKAELPGVFPLMKGDKAVWLAYPLLTPALRRTLENLSGEDQAALLADLAYELEHDGKSCLYLYDAPTGAPVLSPWALQPTHGLRLAGEITQEESLAAVSTGETPMLEAARQVYEPQVLQALSNTLGREALVAAGRATKKRSRLLRKLADERVRLEGMVALQKPARALQQYLWAVDPNQKTAGLDIPGEYAPNGALMRLTLDPRKTVTENMERMFHEASRGKRGLAILAQRICDIQNAPATAPDLRSNKAPEMGPAGKKSKRLQQQMRLIQRFASSGNISGLPAEQTAGQAFQIWRGRSAEGNHALLQAASPQDIWMHVKDGPSAHVLIKRISTAETVPHGVLLDAAALCLNKSWRKDEAKAEVIYALAKDVKSIKGGKTGSVLLNKTLGSVMASPAPSLEEKLRQPDNG